MTTSARPPARKQAAPSAGAGADDAHADGEDRDLSALAHRHPHHRRFWADRQRTNRETSIAFGSRRLREAGNLRNLELAAEQVADPTLPPRPEAYQGPVFMDSDVYKWLEAVLWEHAREPSSELLAEVETFSQALAKAQADDGYLNTFVQVTRADQDRYRDLAMGHELYCFGHLLQAGVAAHRVLGDCLLWQVTLGVADHLTATFGPEGNPGLDGHPVVEMALVELYRETGDPDHLALARHFVDSRGRSTVHGHGREPIYYSDRVPVAEAVSPEGHAVRAMYLAAGASDVAIEDERAAARLEEALERQWAAMVESKQYLTGGLGSRWDGESFGDPFELPPDVAYAETCASIGAVQWAWRRLVRTGRVMYADAIERLLLNGFVSGVSLSGEEFFYVNALQVREGAVPHDHRHPVNGRQKWFRVACCPPNVMRTLSQLSGYLATTGGDKTLTLHQYAPSILQHRGRELRVETAYPWDGHITVEVGPPHDEPHDEDESAGAEWTLALRVPGWCEDASLTDPDGVTSHPGSGYVEVTRRWRTGDRVELDLAMPVRLTRPHPRVDAVRGCLAIERGPLVYAIEQVDLPDGPAVDDLQLPADDPSTLETAVATGPSRRLRCRHRRCDHLRGRDLSVHRGALRAVGQPWRRPDARVAAARGRCGEEPVIPRRVVASLLLAGLAASALLAGCGGTLPSPDVSAPGFGQHAHGTVQLWVRAATVAASTPIVDDFNRTHDDVTVKMTAIPDAQYITKLATAIRGRHVPDVVDVDDINSTLLAYHEALTDLTPLVRGLPYRDRLSHAHAALATYKGRMYGVPYLADISVLYYNKQLFRRAGLDPDRPPRTLDEVLSAARKVHALGHGVSGFSFGGNSPGIMGFTALPSVWANPDDRPFTGPLSHQKAHVVDNPSMRRMLSFYRAVWTEGLSSPSSRTETGPTWGKDFLSGKVGMWPGNEGALIAAGITSKFARQVGVVALPGATTGTSVFAGGDNIAIPRGADNAAGAWEYIRYALRVKEQSSLPAAGYTPVRTDVATKAFVRRYPRTAVALRALDQVGYAPKTLAYNTAVNQVSGPFFQMFTAVVFHGGGATALRDGQTGMERALLQAES